MNAMVPLRAWTLLAHRTSGGFQWSGLVVAAPGDGMAAIDVRLSDLRLDDVPPNDMELHDWLFPAADSGVTHASGIGDSVLRRRP